MYDFDIVHAIYWTTVYRVWLDCYDKTETSSLLGQGSIVVVTSKRNPFAKSFSAHIEGEDMQIELASVLVLLDFHDLFVDIHGFSLVRDLKFNIELLPETTPIHRESYHMLLVEAEELWR